MFDLDGNCWDRITEGTMHKLGMRLRRARRGRGEERGGGASMLQHAGLPLYL